MLSCDVIVDAGTQLAADAAEIQGIHRDDQARETGQHNHTDRSGLRRGASDDISGLQTQLLCLPRGSLFC